MHSILPILIGGLVLFIYSISKLSNELQYIFSKKSIAVVEKYTSNIFYSIIIGAILTVLLGSSSAIIIIVIVFINAKTLNFRQAIGIIMGANIGTTFSSQLIAFDIGHYSVIPLALGLFIGFFVKNEKIKHYCNVVFFFGMLFFGLHLIEQSVLPLKESDIFYNWLTQVEDKPINGALIGGLITLIIQSSSGTVGMAIILGKQKILSVAAGLAIMLGAELGTCSDTLIATLNGSRQALKAGIFHLLFNLTTIILGLIFFKPFVNLVELISKNVDIGTRIANGHMLFNILGVLILLPFVRLVEKGLNKLIPEKRNNKVA